MFEVLALYPRPLAYIFTIFVAFQGVAILVFFVLLSKPVKEAYSKWWKIKATKSKIYCRLFDWVTSNTVRQVSDNEENNSYSSDVVTNKNCSGDVKQCVVYVEQGVYDTYTI